jgi:hypothetical protein
MSTGLTANYNLSYPLPEDPVDVASDMRSLALGLDSFLTNPSFINSISIASGSLVTSALSASLFNTNATTLNIGGAAATTNIGSSSGQVNFAGDVNIATGKRYEINNISVLTATTLGSSVVSSSLTSVGTIASGTWNATTISVNKGGTGLTSYAVGDIVYASGSTTLAKLSGVATGNALLSGGVGVAPSYGKVGLTTHVSGTLPVANGGTGVTSKTGTGNVVLSASPALSGIPTAPTATTGDTTTQIATTEFVQATLLGFLPSRTGNDGKYLTLSGGNLIWGALGSVSATANTLALRSSSGGLSVVSPTAAGSKGVRELTMSTAAPTGGADGDVWLQYS